MVGSGLWSSSAITMHIQGCTIRLGYRPTIFNVGPGGGQFRHIQDAINSIAGQLVGQAT